ncbi:hypothetical protein M2451_000223 [Dysgonomonas sp. PFB1-18]|uniref:hypothetical protein n=1 Tax=unclassified Dysgonomonas TaxID=2630389 RepID=UPI002475FEB0|nr:MULTISPECIES: hypothetical protein [unclassified Dysgonomonas]MDH6307774.1 hypothetical protein [Dysgonomonas sp. PF1-14]MDH6337692.1 hypothetical protein [Dysgonomonas sp. PF1-16]MDH6378916.1 hypothetical protein [Dysgonomonas sp. PFB1-18]MDH6396551.1 hypothetical protein [Dysgonomonas sp. PF1-23]
MIKLAFLLGKYYIVTFNWCYVRYVYLKDIFFSGCFASKIKFCNGRLFVKKPYLLSGATIAAPAVFINKSIFINLGGCNEKYKMADDGQLWFRFVENGYRIFFLKEILVGYRVHEKSLSNIDLPK